MSTYQYAVRREGGGTLSTEAQPRRRDAEDAARDWCVSPLRTGKRRAWLLRRRGWTHAWEVLATWTSPPL